MQLHHCFASSAVLLIAGFFVVFSSDGSPGRSFFVVIAGGIMLLVIWLGTVEYSNPPSSVVFGMNVALAIVYFSVAYAQYELDTGAALLIGACCLAHMVCIGCVLLVRPYRYPKAAVQVIPMGLETHALEGHTVTIAVDASFQDVNIVE